MISENSQALLFLWLIGFSYFIRLGLQIDLTFFVFLKLYFFCHVWIVRANCFLVQNNLIVLF